MKNLGLEEFSSNCNNTEKLQNIEPVEDFPDNGLFAQFLQLWKVCIFSMLCFDAIIVTILKRREIRCEVKNLRKVKVTKDVPYNLGKPQKRNVTEKRKYEGTIKFTVALSLAHSNNHESTCEVRKKVEQVSFTTSLMSENKAVIPILKTLA